MNIEKKDLPQKMLQKWGATTLQEYWTNVPNILLTHQAVLRLSNTELVLLINLMSYEHDFNSPIYPSIATLAERQGLHERSIQRAINRLIQKGMLEKLVRAKHPEQKGVTNIYSISPLKRKLEDLAKNLNS